MSHMHTCRKEPDEQLQIKDLRQTLHARIGEHVVFTLMWWPAAHTCVCWPLLSDGPTGVNDSPLFIYSGDCLTQTVKDVSTDSSIIYWTVFEQQTTQRASYRNMFHSLLSSVLRDSQCKSHQKELLIKLKPLCLPDLIWILIWMTFWPFPKLHQVFFCINLTISSSWHRLYRLNGDKDTVSASLWLIGIWVIYPANLQWYISQYETLIDSCFKSIPVKAEVFINFWSAVINENIEMRFKNHVCLIQVKTCVIQ